MFVEPHGHLVVGDGGGPLNPLYAVGTQLDFDVSLLLHVGRPELPALLMPWAPSHGDLLSEDWMVV